MTPAKTKAKRKVFINIRALENQRDIIDRAAETLGKSRTDFMLESACREAQSVLLDQRFFFLDEEAYKRFVEILDAPPAPNDGLKRLAKVKPVWE